MKKLLKFIPLLVLPLALTACPLLDKLGGNGEQSQTTTESTTSVYPTSLTISGENEIAIGEVVQLTATYAPSNVTDKTVTWSTSDKTIVDINSRGKIQGKAAGHAVITASMKGKNKTTVTATHEVTVVAPDPTGIHLSSTSCTLGFGKTKQLTAIIDPTGAESAVTWSSNNTSVATVSDSGLVTAKNATGTAVITATAVTGGFTATCTVSVKEVTGTTVMIYMCGADLESESGLATSDLDEILSVSGQPEEVNIVIETGGANSWSKSQIPANKLARWEIRNRQFIKKQELTYASMGLTSTLQSFLEWSFQNYSSENYGLILWNHGGAMGGCCFDERASDDSLLANEVYDAVTNARNSKGITNKLEWITYDACLMAVQDVAEYNSYNFNYMLASQESEGGYGYDYDAWLPTLYNDPGISGADLLPVIGHTFIEEEKTLYQGWYGSRWQQYFDQTQSVFDLSKMSAYKTAFESIATDLYSIVGSNSSKASNLGQLIGGAKEYGCDEYGDSSGFESFDMKDALNKVKANSSFSSISSKVTSFYNVLDEMIIYEEHGQGTLGCGICLYSPWKQAYPYNYGSTEYRKSNFTEWKKVSDKIFEACYDPYGY